ncbi:MAG TPA: translation elongation factor Ts [Candidatus Dormibacteraeota bacterium]|nr:translation elongation factor Ts [Candidatus Dormibacteraeota bacterium]
MADISAALVKQLRERTGAGIMDSKRALEETGGDLEKAEDVLRKKGIAKAASKAGRTANEGIVSSYLHNSGSGAKLGVLVELNCESDFVAKTEDFHALAREIALQVAGASPRYVRREEVPGDVVAREVDIYRAQAAGKPENVVEKIVTGKLEDFYRQVVLLDQVWIKDEQRRKRVDDLIKDAIAKVGENISVARFARFVVGEAPRNGDGGAAGGAATTESAGA